MRPFISLLALSFLVAGLATTAGRPAAAQSLIEVNTTDDEFDTAPNAQCSLREAIQSANTGSPFGGCIVMGSGSPYTVGLPPATYALSRAGAGEDGNANGDLDILATVTVLSAPGVSTIDGADLDRVFDAHPGSTLAVDRVVIRNGSVDIQGGGVRVIGATFRATRCVIEDNESLADGGGIFADTGVTISIAQCEIRNNVADANQNGTNRGGAMYIADPAGAVNTVLIQYSTLSGNNGDSFGGAISTLGTATTQLTIINSTISGNTSALAGGGLSTGGPTVLDAVTIVGNTSNTTSSTGGGGGVRVVNGPLTLRNTIVAGNDAVLVNCDDVSLASGSIITQGANLIGENTCEEASFPTGTPNGNGDWVGSEGAPIDPLLAPLADNGGPTRTHAILAGSVAQDNGNTVLSDDQRLMPRDATPDIGSFEIGLPTATAPGPADAYVLSAVTPNPTRGTARLTLTLRDAQRVRATLFDVAGRRVQLALDGVLTPGVGHEVTIDGAALTAGVYVLRIAGERFEATRRLVVAR